LIELTVGMAVAMLVIGGAVAIYSNTAKSQRDALNLARLAQNTHAAMQVMTLELARSGFVGDSTDSFPLSNPFFSTTSGSSTDLAVYNGGSCIVFAYNRDNDSPPVVDSNERLGFRLSSNTLQTRTGGAVHNDDCGSGSWESLLAPDIEVTALNFVVTSNSVDASTGATTCSSGNRCMALREVSISLTARLSSDTSVQQSLLGRARLRNLKVTVQP
jgi:type IV pilus assembly protein PilW